MTHNTPNTRRASGALFGMAYGDSLGSQTEFIRSVKTIMDRYPPLGPENLPRPARVTDDTQMGLAVGAALLDVGQPLTIETLEPALRRRFLEWYHSPDNTRAPGATCLAACANLDLGMDWWLATMPTSKGCGANMRVVPVGLLPQIDDTARAGLAQFQAAMTHGHPTGLAAADLTAMTVYYLANGKPVSGVVEWLHEYAQSQMQVYHEDWLGPLWETWNMDSPDGYIETGWEDCLFVLGNLEHALKYADPLADPCLETGGGWIAEECFATALYCFLLFPNDPVAAIQRAATSSGDSDSIACLTGAFAGAALGMAAWPAEWARRIEYRRWLAKLGAAWDGAWA